MDKKSPVISRIKNKIFSIIYRLKKRNTELGVTEEKEQPVDSEPISRSENETKNRLNENKEQLIDLKTELRESIDTILNKLFEGISGLLEDEYKNKLAGLESRIEDLEGEKGEERGADFDFTTSKGEYLLSWDSVPGNDSENLIRFLGDEFDISWAEDAEISKSDDDNTICISKDENSAEIEINEKKEKAILKISDGRTLDLKVKKENGKLNIYSDFIALEELAIEKSKIREEKEKIDEITKMGLTDFSIHDLKKIWLIMNTASLLSEDDKKIQGLDEETIRLFDPSDPKFICSSFKKRMDEIEIPLLYNKGVKLLKEGNFESGRECFDKITMKDPYLKGAWLNRGYALGMSGQIDEEIRSYNKALNKDENYKLALHNIKIAEKEEKKMKRKSRRRM